MANKSRLMLDKNNRMMIPMNVEGGVWDEGFLNTTKVCVLIVMVFLSGGIVLWTKSAYLSMWSMLLVYGILMAADITVIRYLIFEENYYYGMYEKLKKHEISTPSVFWNIVSVRDTENGAVMIYGDGKIGMMVKVERDTITGKNEDFKEHHYDILSDFYRELNKKGIKFVQMNVMEPAGKDPRLPKLDKLAVKSENKNICKIVEAQIGYIKRITRASLFETDYFLLYRESEKMDALVNDVLETTCMLLDGAVNSVGVLGSKDIMDIVKEEYGVRLFDYTETLSDMYRNEGIKVSKAFRITGITFDTGEYMEIDPEGLRKLHTFAEYLKNGTVNKDTYNIKDILDGYLGNGMGVKTVRFDELEEETESEEEMISDLDNEIFSSSPVGLKKESDDV